MALRAEPRDFEGVRGGLEAVRPGCLSEPFVDLTALELGDAVAAGTDEMVVVPFAAQAVARLARPVCELIHDTVLAEQRKRAIDRGEAHRLAALAEARVDLLCRRVMRLGSEGLEDEQTLARSP